MVAVVRHLDSERRPQAAVGLDAELDQGPERVEQHSPRRHAAKTGRIVPVALILLADESFWDKNGDWISAAISLALAFVLAFAVDRFVIHRATRVAARVGGGDVTVSR